MINGKKFIILISKLPDSLKTEKKLELVFIGSGKLIFDNNEGQTHGKVFLTKRPGWKGIIIPSHCYIFDISINDVYQPYQKYIGHFDVININKR